MVSNAESDSDSDGSIKDFLALSGDIDFDDHMSDDEEPDPAPMTALPLYSLSEVETLIITSNSSSLELLQKQVLSMEGLDKANKTVQLQLYVLELSIALAKGHFFDVLEHPSVSSLITSNDLKESQKLEEYFHARVVTFIDKGIGANSGAPEFREPNAASPDAHVSQRVLRAAVCLIFGAACLGLFRQANWTGPPLKSDKLDKFYPLPFAQKVGFAEEIVDSMEQEMLDRIEADAKAASAISGKVANVDDIDSFPRFHFYSAEKMEVNGEPLYCDARFIHYLHISRIVLRCLTRPTIPVSAAEPDCYLPTPVGEKRKEPPPAKVPQHFRWAVTHLKSSRWWAARSATCHQETLELKNAQAPSLLLEVETCMDKTSEGPLIADNWELKSRLYLEYGVMLHKLRCPDKAKVAFHQSRETAELTMSLTGELGKRTKFQESKSQLLLLAQSKSTKKAESTEDIDDTQTESLPTPSNDEVPPQQSNTPDATDEKKNTDSDGDSEKPMQLGKKKVLGIRTILLSELDDMTPLHESIQYTTSDFHTSLAKSGQLSSLDQSIVLGLCIDVKNSYAMEGLTAEEMSAYVARVLQHPTNWMVYSTALLLKSHLEFERTKTKERAVLQMQLLVDQQSERLTPLQQTQKEIDEAASVQERCTWLDALVWPPLWQLQRDLADRYLSLGVAGSALNIFQQVRLWEEAVDCLVAMEKKSRAEKLVAERLKIRPSANLYCQMGILKQEPEWFKRAWDFSKHRYARAKRLWAIASFELGNLEDCVKHMEDAVRINPLFPHAWFRMGAASMRLGDFAKARHAFLQVTTQEPSDGDAWANLSTVYDKLGDTRSALSAIQTASKHLRNSWRVWENLLTFSLKLKDWSACIQALNRLVDLRIGLSSNKDGVVDTQALVLVVEGIITESKLVEQNKTRCSDSEENLKIRERHVEFLRRQMDSLFNRMKAECKSDANAWKIMSVYYKSFEQNSLFRDALIKRVRALQIDEWERDETQAKRIIRAVKEVANAYISDSKEDPDQLNHLNREAAMLVQTSINKLLAGESFASLATPLQDLLKQLELES